MFLSSHGEFENTRIISETHSVQHHKIFLSDLTGAFTHQLIHGKLYGTVVYNFDSDAILAKTIKQ